MSVVRVIQWLAEGRVVSWGCVLGAGTFLILQCRHRLEIIVRWMAQWLAVSSFGYQKPRGNFEAAVIIFSRYLGRGTQ